MYLWEETAWGTGSVYVNVTPQGFEFTVVNNPAVAGETSCVSLQRGALWLKLPLELPQFPSVFADQWLKVAVSKCCWAESPAERAKTG